MKEKSIPNFRVLSILLAVFLAGIFASSFFKLDFYRIYPLAIMSGLIILAIDFIFRDYIIKIISAGAIIFFAGFSLYSFVNTKFNNTNLPFGQKKEFAGTVANYPDVNDNSQSFYLSTSDFGQSVKIYIQTSRYPEYSYGDKVKIIGTIEKPANFSDFDWVSYLKRYGATAVVSRNSTLNKISTNGGNKTLKNLYLVRHNFENTVQKNLPEPESSLASGIEIGTKQGFSENLLDQFGQVGITHIIALSGYNVTIFIEFLVFLFLGLLNRKTIFVMSSILILLFVAMTGAASSVIRAAIISLLIVFGRTIGRKADMTNLILLAAAVMVTINPFILRYDRGFQLSFLAFAGLIYFAKPIRSFFDLPYLKKIPKTITLGIVETLSAQIAVLPLLLTTFGRISIIAPLANILVLPVIPVTMLFIFLSWIIHLLIPPIGKLAFLICYLPLKYILIIAKYFSEIPLASLQISGFWQIIIAMIYSAVVLAIFIFYKFRLWPRNLNSTQ